MLEENIIYLFIEIEYSNPKEENLTKYYSLVNQTSYQETEYYTFKTKNNKISISQEESYPTMILEVVKNEGKNAIYDIRLVRKLNMCYNLSARYEEWKLESSLYGVTLIHI